LQQYLNRLKIRVSVLGNHQQKYIRTIEQYLEPLVENLENAGKLEIIHLWKGSTHLTEEMDTVLGVASSLEQKLNFISCYYALQILHLNLRSIDILKLKLTGIRAEKRLPIYRQFMLQTGKEFRMLTAAFMQKLIELFAGSASLPEFTILGVGSLAHQDDIDVGVIDDGATKREFLNKVINQVRKRMFKHATELHFYLSEHVGSAYYTASIQEYRDLLDKEIQDFVIISEMLNAVPILGSRRLYKKFTKDITLRYHYRANSDNKYHEGYLRGILGEIRSLLLGKINEKKLNPQDDALRMISILTLASKTIFRIYKGNRWDILSSLLRHDPERGELYSNLEKALTFFEIFRHLYQLYIGLEEDIYLDDPVIVESLEKVAETMGYQPKGAISAWDHLLIHYHEYVDLAKNSASTLLIDVTGHIKTMSLFADMAKAIKQPDPYRSYPGNVAVDFLKATKFFRGTKFWDDIIEVAKDRDSYALFHFVNDFHQLKPRLQQVLIEKYGLAFQQSLYSSITFLEMLARHKNKLACAQLSFSLNEVFIKNLLKQGVDHVYRIIRLFSWYPDLLNNFLTKLTPDQQKSFLSFNEKEVWEPELQSYQSRLKSLCQIHLNTSHYFKRFFTRIVSQQPIYIHYLENPDSLQQIAQGILGTIDSIINYNEQKNQLNRYHDIEFLRVGLEALQGASFDRINEQFTEFSDNYLQILFDICKQEVADQIGGSMPTSDSLAIYAAGGHAREQAFDDDWDLIVLLNEKNDELRDFGDRVISKMNSEIISRGTMPHYRFADHFGHYVTLVDELVAFFSTETQETFIDKSQVLGARKIVGSTKFQKEFNRKIIKPFVFDNCQFYVRQMINEMKSRHQEISSLTDNEIDIKEGVGGLRDIEFILLIFKAKYQLDEPLNWKLINSLGEKLPQYKEKFIRLKQNSDFIKRLRDLYRLTVSADDILQTAQLGLIAHIMNYHSKQNKTATEKLIEDYFASATEVNEIIEFFIQGLNNC